MCRHRSSRNTATQEDWIADGSNGSWLRKNVSERFKPTSDWLASTLKRADWLFLRLRGLETLLKLPEVILSDLEPRDKPLKPGSPPGAASRRRCSSRA